MFVTVPLMVMGVLGSPVGGVTEVIATLTNPEAVRAWAGDDPVTTVAKTINRPSSQAAGRRREGEGTSVMVVGRPASAVTIRKVLAILRGPPGQQCVFRLVGSMRAFIQAKVEQEFVRLANLRSRLDT